jgi:hypothetical protein
MTTATFPHTMNAKAVAAYSMKKTWSKGHTVYSESARFTEYDNGVILVATKNEEWNGPFWKEDARAIAAKLQSQGFKFI